MTSIRNRNRRLVAPIRMVTILSMLVLAVAAVAWAADPSPVASVNTANGIALKGYDPVAYFTTGHATNGRDAYTYRWKDVTYRFASAEHRDRFAAAPDTYLPQYGGYCAFAMAIDRIADVDPERWAIVDGKLYLNNNRWVHTIWSVNKGGNITAADRNWAVRPKVVEAQ